MFTSMWLQEDCIPGGCSQPRAAQAWKEGPGARSPPSWAFGFLGLKATWDPAFPPCARCKQGGRVGAGRGPGGASSTGPHFDKLTGEAGQLGGAAVPTW